MSEFLSDKEMRLVVGGNGLYGEYTGPEVVIYGNGKPCGNGLTCIGDYSVPC